MATKHPVKALPYANDALKGIGAKTIEIHHDKLYAGYVNKRNEIEEELAKVDRSKANQIYSDYLLRARYSNRQLNEVMTEFWSNHFDTGLQIPGGGKSGFR